MLRSFSRAEGISAIKSENPLDGDQDGNVRPTSASLALCYLHSMIRRPLETRRLLLRPLELEDAEDAERLFPQWEIVQYLTAAIPWPFPKGTVLPRYRDIILPAIERGEQWHWSLRLKDSPDRMIGKISLQIDEWDNRGYWLGLPWQRQGLMTEAVAAVNDFWFDELGFSVLRAPKAVANIASRRVSEKTGMRLIATLERDYVSGRLPAGIWEITADEWRAWKKRPGNAPGI